MKTRILALSLCLLLCLPLAACQKEAPLADLICCREYSAALGDFGSFSVASQTGGELETVFSDLSQLTLGQAFSEMKIEQAAYEEENNCVTFSLSGPLSEGETGLIEGPGILKNKSARAEIPIAPAEAASSSRLFAGVETQTISLELKGACFRQDLSASDFLLSGAARQMTVLSVTADFPVSADGETSLPQTATLTLSGAPDGSDYAYLEIAARATTYHKPLTLALPTDFTGAQITNDHIDTFTLSDTVSVQANHLSFRRDISTESLSLEGCLKDYADLEEVRFISESELELRLSFPYTYLESNDNLGYIAFSPASNEEGIAFSCSALVAAPAIHSDVKINGRAVSLELSLEHEEFNLLSSYPFCVYNAAGEEILVSGVDIVNLDNTLSISFLLPESCEGLLLFELQDAYDVITPQQTSKNIPIRTYFYL